MDTIPLLDRLAHLHPQASKTTLRDMIAGKRVRINGELARSAKQLVAPADKVQVADAGGESTALSHGLQLVYFDCDLIIIDKPAGLLTSTDAQEQRPTAWRMLTTWFRKQNHKNQVHLIHRLDRDASGLLVFARTWEAYASLKQQFFEHTITRQYDVIVHGMPRPPKGRLEHLLMENEQGIVHITPDMKRGKLAILDYEVIATSKARHIARVRCTLFTGRKHQIRVQFKAIGHAVCGDPVYAKADEPPGRLALHATHLAFQHPRTKKPVAFDSPMPGSFAHLFRADS